MEIKRCTNCGSFITSEESICSKCINKASFDQTLLKNFFDENQSYGSISAISAATGVNPSSIQKYMQENNYADANYNPTTFSSIQY